MIDAAERSRQDQVNRRGELHINMMRSMITEPLLSKVQQAGADQKFDVIISLNELFKDGIDTALALVRARAEQWHVNFATVSHYCFACLTKEQILRLAAETRELNSKYGPSGPVVFRIWEDTDVNAGLTHSISTIKADAAQRSFRALGESIVWAVLDSGTSGNSSAFPAARFARGRVQHSPGRPASRACRFHASAKWRISR